MKIIIIIIVGYPHSRNYYNHATDHKMECGETGATPCISIVLNSEGNIVMFKHNIYHRMEQEIFDPTLYIYFTSVSKERNIPVIRNAFT